MPRIRTIKPAFFQNEELADVPFAHRLLFIGLWTMADRQGRLEDKPRRIKAALFPYDKLNVDQMLTDLARGRDPFIVRYSVAGYRYILVKKFLEHQRPHYSEPESLYPAPAQHDTDAADISAVTAEDSAAAAELSSIATLGREGKGKEGKGKEGDRSTSAVRRPSTPAPPSPVDLVHVWNQERGTLPRCAQLTDKRKRMARHRLTDRGLDEWRQIIQRIRASDFCRGENDRGWQASFDWLLQPDVGAKVLEGKYDNRPRLHASSSRTGRSTDAARQYLREHLTDEDIEGEVVNANPRMGTKG